MKIKIVTCKRCGKKFQAFHTCNPINKESTMNFEEFIKTLSTSELISLIMDYKVISLIQTEMWSRTDPILF